MIVQLGEGVRARAESPNAWSLETRESPTAKWLNVSYHASLQGACLRAVERGIALPAETVTITDLVTVLRRAVEAIQTACRLVPAPMPQPEPPMRPSRPQGRYPARLEDFIAPTEPAESSDAP